MKIDELTNELRIMLESYDAIWRSGVPMPPVMISMLDAQADKIDALNPEGAPIKRTWAIAEQRRFCALFMPDGRILVRSIMHSDVTAVEKLYKSSPEAQEAYLILENVPSGADGNGVPREHILKNRHGFFNGSVISGE